MGWPEFGLVSVMRKGATGTYVPMTGVVACGVAAADAASASGPRSRPVAATSAAPNRIGMRPPAFSCVGS